jgi:hypothetical protein
LLIRSDKFLYCVGPSWSSTAQALTASCPDPPDGGNEAPPTPALTWLPGQTAAKHQVYFSDSRAAVSQGAAEADKGVTSQTTLAPGDLEPAAVYFWRVDETTATGAVHTGSVWRLATFLPVDVSGLRGRENKARICETWLDGWTHDSSARLATPASLRRAQFVRRTAGHAAGIQQRGPPYYSETSGRSDAQDWTAHDVNALVLYVRGVATNQPARFYLGLEDASRQAAAVIHPDPAVAAGVRWARWEIPLRDFTDVNLARVKKLYIGVGDRANPLPGDKGRLYIDDLRLVRPISVP